MLDKIKSLFGPQDMTVGKPWSCLMKFIIPMLIGNIAQMLLTTFDRVIVGKYFGDPGIGAVGASMPILNIFLVFFMAVGTGVTVMVAQYYGAKDFERLGKTVGNTITLMAIISVVVTAIAVPLTGPILRALDTAPELFDYAYEYLVILFAGCFTVGFYNSFTGVLRGIGSSIFPLIVLLCSVAVNAVLDVLFVAPWGLNLGIAGAAYATCIAQIGAAVACMLRVFRFKHLFTLNKSKMRLDKIIVKQITRLGLPTGISMAVMFATNLITQPYMMRMGYEVVAAMVATMSVDGFAVMPSQAFSMGVSTYTGQNIGAGKQERLRPGMFATLKSSLLVTTVMLAAILIFGRQVLGLFTKTPKLIEMGMGFIYIMIPGYYILAINMTLQGVMRGAGDSIGTMWLSVLTNVIVRVPAIIIIINLTKSEELPGGDPNSIFYGMLIAMSVGLISSLIYYRIGRWKTKAIVKAPVAPEPVLE